MSVTLRSVSRSRNIDALDPAALQVAMRRLAERRAEGADEVRLRDDARCAPAPGRRAAARRCGPSRRARAAAADCDSSTARLTNVIVGRRFATGKRTSFLLRACAADQARTNPGRGSLRPPAASRCCARKLAARSFPRRPPAAWSWRKLATARTPVSGAARAAPAAQRYGARKRHNGSRDTTRSICGATLPQGRG